MTAVVFTDGHYFYRRCRPGDEETLHGAGAGIYAAVIADLSTQLEVDRSARYQSRSDGRRVLVCVQDEVSIGVSVVSFSGGGLSADVRCDTIRGRCDPEAVLLILAHTLEWLRSLGVTSCDYRARIRDDDDGYAGNFNGSYRTIPPQLNDSHRQLVYRDV